MRHHTTQRHRAVPYHDAAYTVTSCQASAALSRKLRRHVSTDALPELRGSCLQVGGSQAIAALVAGSYAATREMARLLGEEEFSVLFHQGKKDNVQLTLIGDRTILATVFDERTTIGMVRVYAKEASVKLSKIFEEIKGRRDDGENILGTEFSESAKNHLDNFFAE